MTMCNFANLNSAMRGGLLECRGGVLAAGAVPTLDFANATAFLAGFNPMIDMALKPSP